MLLPVLYNAAQEGTPLLYSSLVQWCRAMVYNPVQCVSWHGHPRACIASSAIGWSTSSRGASSQETSRNTPMIHAAALSHHASGERHFLPGTTTLKHDPIAVVSFYVALMRVVETEWRERELERDARLQVETCSAGLSPAHVGPVESSQHTSISVNRWLCWSANRWHRTREGAVCGRWLTCVLRC